MNGECHHLNWPEAFAIVGGSFAAVIFLLGLTFGPHLLVIWAATKGFEFEQRKSSNHQVEEPLEKP